MNVYLVNVDGLRRIENAVIVAENEGDAYDLLMAELKERMLAQSGPRIEEIKRKLAEGPVDWGATAAHLLEEQDC